MSTQVTSLPKSEKPAPVTSPTYPVRRPRSSSPPPRSGLGVALACAIGANMASWAPVNLTTPALDATLPFLNALDDAPAGAADPLIGARLKHFQVKKLLGKGGMGAVYLAEDTSLGRQVALKVLDRASRRRSRDRRPLRPRGARAGAAPPSQHHADLLHRRRGRRALLRDGVSRRTSRSTAARARRARCRGTEAISVCEAAAPRARRRAQRGLHSPRRQAVEPARRRLGQVKLADFGLAKSVRGDAELTRAG